MQRVPYKSTIGSMIYAAMCKRPNICYAEGIVSRCQSNPGQMHWKVVKRISWYLKGAADNSLFYQGSDLHLISYLDANWADGLEERAQVDFWTSFCF